MDTFETLLKVAQSRLDEVSREAGIAAEHMASLNARLVSLGESHQRASSGGEDVSILIAAGAYRLRHREEREELEAEIEAQREVLSGIRARLTLAFQEKSKFEQLIAQDHARRARAAAAQEQKQLDEAALRGLQRRS